MPVRLALGFFLLAATLFADAITFTESTVGDSFVLHSVYVNPSPPYNVSTSLGGQVTNQQPGPVPSFTTSLTIDLYTAGPPREGLINLNMLVSDDGDYAIGNASASIGSFTIAGCPPGVDCTMNGLFAFELGVPFTITLTAYANGALLSDGGFGSGSQISFTLYEDDSGYQGSPVEVMLAPEPGPRALELGGLGALIFLQRLRRLRE